LKLHVEAAKMAPRLSPELALLYDQAKAKGNANRATLAVARKLVASLMAIDRRPKNFLVVEKAIKFILGIFETTYPTFRSFE